MFNEKNKIKWQWFNLIYALVWLFIFLYILTLRLGQTSSESLFYVYWPLALAAGGIGGVIAIFYSLYWHGVMKKDFKPYFTIYYVLHPFGGMVAGLLVHTIFSAIVIVLDGGVLPNPTLLALSIVISWMAGFRQNAFGWTGKIANLFYREEKDKLA